MKMINMIKRLSSASVCFVVALRCVLGLFLFLPLHCFMTFEIQEFTSLSPISNWGEIFKDTSLGFNMQTP